MSKGITLIETIIGLAILSFGMLAIIAAFPLGLRSLSRTQQTNAALFLASSKVEELSGRRYEELELGTSIESFNMEDYGSFEIETEINCFNTEQENCSEEGIKKIKVIVFSTNQESEEVVLTTLITQK